MKNVDVIELFVSGRLNVKGTKNLHVANGRLINYTTVIGQWYCGTLFINKTKYSSSTSTIQNKLYDIASSVLGSSRVSVIDGVPKGSDSVFFEL